MASTEFGPASSSDIQDSQFLKGSSPGERADEATGARERAAADGDVAADLAAHAPAVAVATRKVGTYVIESGVAMPDFESQGSRGRYPFGELKVGESVVIRDVAEATLDGARRSWLVRRGIDLRKVRVEGGFRVFRVA